LDVLGTQLAGSQKAVEVISNMEELDKSGIFTNKTAGFVTAVTNLAQNLGLKVDAEKLANTETYQGEVARLWLALMETVTGGARGLTEAETKELKAAVPNIKQSPLARQKIYGLYRRAATRDATRFQKSIDALAEALEADDVAKITRALGGMYTTEVPPPPLPLEGPQPQGRLRPYTGPVERR
jgi:hypothetical protein